VAVTDELLNGGSKLTLRTLSGLPPSRVTVRSEVSIVETSIAVVPL